MSAAPVNACSHWPAVFVTHARPTWRATAAGVGDRKGLGSDVDPCSIMRSGTSTR